MEKVATMITNTLEWCLIKQISRMDLEELFSKIINSLLMGISKMEKEPFIIDRLANGVAVRNILMERR